MALLATVNPLPERVSAHAEICVETISDYRAFLDLEPAWDRLAKAARLDHPFLEHAWVRTWWECFGAGSTLRILLLKAGGELIAIAPLILTPVRMWGLQVQRLGFLYNAHVPRADFLVAERPEEVYRVVWEWLSRNRDWDLVQLCQLWEKSTTLQAVRALAVSDGYGVVTWQSGSSPLLPIGGSWRKYLEGLTGKHRSNLRNRLKRLNLNGPVDVETIAAPSELNGALEAGMRLEAAAWKGENRTAISSDPSVSRFYSTLAGRAAEHGWIRLHFLRAGAMRIAFDYSLAYSSRIYLLKIGYDPAYARYSPSSLLLYLELQDLFERGDVQEFEFLGENTDWKSQWTELSEPNYWLFVFAPTLKGRILHSIKSKLVPYLKRERLRPLRNLFVRLAGHAPAETT